MNIATIVNKQVTEAPVEQIKWENLTGLSDDDLFGPAFLYKNTEFDAEKKVIPASDITKMTNDPPISMNRKEIGNENFSVPVKDNVEISG